MWCCDCTCVPFETTCRSGSFCHTRHTCGCFLLLCSVSSSSPLFSQLFVIYHSSYVSVLEPSLQARRLIYIWNASADVLEVFCRWRVLLRRTSLLTGHLVSPSQAKNAVKTSHMETVQRAFLLGNCAAYVLSTWGIGCPLFTEKWADDAALYTSSCQLGVLPKTCA